MLIDTLGVSLEAETTKVMLVTDAYTPDFNVHDFRNDVEANEVSGAGYTAGGATLTGTELTIAGGILIYDANDVAWTNSTITDAMAAVQHLARGGVSSADELVFLSDFVTAASTNAGTFTIQWNAAGLWTIDFTV